MFVQNFEVVALQILTLAKNCGNLLKLGQIFTVGMPHGDVVLGRGWGV